MDTSDYTQHYWVWQSLIHGSNSRKKEEEYYSIANFSDILAKEMLEYAKSFEDHEEHTVVTVSETRTCDDISSLSQDKVIGTHTKIFLDAKHQLRCIWCSRVNLIERKTTLKCGECGKGFCRDSSGSNCWSNHVCFGGVPACPKRGTHKRLVRDINDEENCTRWRCLVFPWGRKFVQRSRVF